MASKNTQNPAPAKTPRQPQNRPPITFELVLKIAPSPSQAEKMSTAFGLDPVDYHGIREGTEEAVGCSAQLLARDGNDVALRIHLQRVVGAFVTSAHGAATFYQEKVSQARLLTSSLANEDRDEDRDAVYGFQSKADRAREFAAKAGLQAFSLLAAAEGAIHAYAAVTGEDWKPFVPQQPNNASVRQRSAAAELEAFS